MGQKKERENEERKKEKRIKIEVRKSGRGTEKI